MSFLRVPLSVARHVRPSEPWEDDEELAGAYSAFAAQVLAGEDPVVVDRADAEVIASSTVFWYGRGEGQLPAKLPDEAIVVYEALLRFDELRNAPSRP